MISGALGSDQLRAAFVDADAQRQDGGEHPAAEAFWGAAARELPAAVCEALLDHVATCAVCAESWRLALEIQRARGVTAMSTPHRGRGRARVLRRWLPGAALAGAAAVAIFLTVMPRHDTANPPAYREDELPALVALVPDGARLPREAFTLRWSAGPAGARYALEVTTSTLAAFHAERDLDEPRATVPAAWFGGVPSGTKFFWRVEAHDAHGTVARSATYTAFVE